jgi:hypothetical protein
MNEAVIEARAGYLIEDRINTTQRRSSRLRRHHRQLRTSSWL